MDMETCRLQNNNVFFLENMYTLVKYTFNSYFRMLITLGLSWWVRNCVGMYPDYIMFCVKPSKKKIKFMAYSSLIKLAV
jgi:hypothetical protein